MTLNQAISVLQPVQTSANHKEFTYIDPESVKRLDKNAEFISNDFCRVAIMNQSDNLPGCHPCKKNDATIIKISGENFGFAFEAEKILFVRSKLEKAFRAAESFTRRAGKLVARRPVPVIEPVNKPAINGNNKSLIDAQFEYIQSLGGIDDIEKNSVNDEILLINTPVKVKKDSKRAYISGVKKARKYSHKRYRRSKKHSVWNILKLKSLNQTLRTLEKFLLKSWKNFAKA